MIRCSSITCILVICTCAAWAQQADPPDLNDLPSYQPQRKVEGTIKVFGSFLKGQMQAWEDDFNKVHPGVQFANNFYTSSEGAMAGLYAAGADIAPAGDDAKLTDVMPFYDTYKYLPLEVSVATGGYEKRGTLWALQIVVHKDNPLTKLTMEQLDDIFFSERTGGWEGVRYTSKYARGPEKNIRTWGQLGLTGEWTSKPIQTYGYSAPGFVVSFERFLTHGSGKWNPNYREYVEEQEATTDQYGKAVASERMLEALSQDKYGIAWGAVMHTKDYPNVKAIAIARTAAGPYVPLTADTVRNRSYPLTRDAYVYLNRRPGMPLDPNVKEFLCYILSREGQQAVIRQNMYNPLTGEKLREELKKLD